MCEEKKTNNDEPIGYAHFILNNFLGWSNIEIDDISLWIKRGIELGINFEKVSKAVFCDNTGSQYSWVDALVKEIVCTILKDLNSNITDVYCDTNTDGVVSAIYIDMDYSYNLLNYINFDFTKDMVLAQFKTMLVGINNGGTE